MQYGNSEYQHPVFIFLDFESIVSFSSAEISCVIHQNLGALIMAMQRSLELRDSVIVKVRSMVES